MQITIDLRLCQSRFDTIIVPIMRQLTYIACLTYLLLLAVACAVAQTAVQATSNNLSTDFNLLPQPNLSGRIAFSAKVDDVDKVFMLDLDARTVRLVIDGPGNSTSPSWSPNGKGLLFVSDRDGNKEIYLANWDGQNVARLTNNGLKDYDPSWSPDGKQIVFSREMPGSNGKASNIYILDLKSSALTQVTDVAGLNSTAQLSPNGLTLAYSTNRAWPGWDICLITLNEIDLTKKSSCPLAGNSSFYRPSWAPDGKSFVYSAGDLSSINLQSYSIDDGVKTYLTEMENREYDAVFAPDGKTIAFVAEGPTADHFEIYSYDLDSRKANKLLASKYSIRSLSWNKTTTLSLEAGRFRDKSAPPPAVVEQKTTNDRP